MLLTPSECAEPHVLFTGAWSKTLWGLCLKLRMLKPHRVPGWWPQKTNVREDLVFKRLVKGHMWEAACWRMSYKEEYAKHSSHPAWCKYVKQIQGESSVEALLYFPRLSQLLSTLTTKQDQFYLHLSPVGGFILLPWQLTPQICCQTGGKKKKKKGDCLI